MTTNSSNPQRTCVGCRKKFPQKDLLAVTRLKDGDVIVNEPYRQLGRSVYVCRTGACLTKVRDAKRKNPLQLGLRGDFPETLWAELETAIHKH